MTDEKKINDIPETEELEKLVEELEEEIEKIIIDEQEVDDEATEAEIAEANGKKPQEMPMITLRGLSIFPNMVLHFDIGREKSIKALEKAMIHDNKVFLVSQKDENTDLPTVGDFYEIGTVARIKQMLKLPGDSIRVLVEGLERGKVNEVLFEVPYFKCTVDSLEEPDAPLTAEVEALKRSVLDEFDVYIDDRENANETFATVATIEHPGRLSDAISAHLRVKVEDKQHLLEELDPVARLRKLYELLVREVEIQQIEADLNHKVKEQMNKNQKEYYLREQMRAIQDELGYEENVTDEAEGWLKKLKKFKIAPKTEKKIEKEIDRYTKLQPMSAESNVSRSYIEAILELPWNKSTKGKIDLNKAEKLLDEDHYGLEKVKERILEYLAVVERRGEIKGPILCLVGPPGVGKTSVAKSIARATGREFTRMSLGGVRDEAEIRGHRRTYIGAIPGRIMTAIKEAGTNNPVFLFDEVDKIGADFKGDPASALLEVLDPEQNKDFMDHYLEVPFDLSKVMFITTANTTDTIPRPLLDRMEIIHVEGYTEEDKVEIAKQHLIPKQREIHGLTAENIVFPESTIRDLINYYTRESGVRNLEREIANICRKVTLKIVKSGKESYRITSKNLESYLGKKRFRYDIIEGQEEVGVTTGLAWTIVGGDTLFIETTVVPGKGNLVLTGQLGEVMQESAKAGISYIRSIADKLGIEENFYKEKDLHVHIPEGAVPKDGPSAGVTMCTAMISTLTNTPVRKDIAMTGEITLRGKVLPVGGIREKVLAAHRAGINKVLLPRDNERDIDDIPEKVRKKMEFVLLDSVEDALREVLVK